MPISSDGDETDSNDGPHCRNCHTGGSNCYVCHSNSAIAYTATITAPVTGYTSFASQSFIKQSAVASTAIGAQCLDAGFSFPHRTLGANMLKDELFGIDFDGSSVAAGETRGVNGGSLTPTTTASPWQYWTAEDKNSGSVIAAVRADSGTLEGAAAENMDSVCIDCHGDSTYYNDSPSFWTKPFAGTTTTPDAYGYGASEGWDLLLHGLP